MTFLLINNQLKYSLFTLQQYYRIIIKLMLSRLSFVICLLVLTSCSYVNVTDFMSSQFTSKLTFEAYTGYEQIDWHYPYGKSGMYYQLFGAHGTTLTQNTSVPLIIWLQGGPGSSSMFGAYTEIGPVLVKNGKL